MFEHNPIRDREALEKFCQSLAEFSPIVGLDTAPQPDSLFLDITGLAHLFGNEAGLVQQLARHCQQLGFHARIGVGDTLRLAWSAACFITTTEETLCHVPVGLLTSFPALDTEVNNVAAVTAEWTGRLPIESFRLPAPTNATLRQLGLTTVSRLLRIPRSHLTARFGDAIHLAIDQFLGVAEEPIVAHTQPPEFYQAEFIEFPTNDRETIEVVLQRLVDKICRSMRVDQKGALEWTIRLNCVESLPIHFQVYLFQPTSTPTQVIPLVSMQLETALQPHLFLKKKTSPKKTSPRATVASQPDSGKITTIRERTQIRIQEIEVLVSHCVLLEERQRQLFDENPRLDKQALAHLVNRLTSRLGKERVLYPTFQSGAQPEYAVRYRPLADPHRTPPRRKPTGSHVLARPLRLLNPPVRLQALGITPDAPTNEPARTPVKNPPQKNESALGALVELKVFSVNNRQHRIKQAWGPERIETGWWRGPTTRRDYWRVETETGCWFWIYRDLRTDEWYLHGEF